MASMENSSADMDIDAEAHGPIMWLGTNPNFTGRQEILQTLHDTLGRHGSGDAQRTVPHVAVLSGMGGIGKTQIALECAHQMQANFPCPVYYIVCSTAATMMESYRRCLGEASSMDVGVEPLVDKFAKQLHELDGPWLVIFDNVCDMDDFNKLGTLRLQMGEGLGSFLVTTRYSPEQLPASIPSAKYKVISVKLMGKHESMELFLKQIGPNDHDPSDLSALVDLMPGMPLVLSMMASTLRRGYSIQSIMEQIGRPVSLDTSHDRQGSHMPSIYLTWSYSSQQLSPLARQHLSYLACFDPDGISIDLLNEYERRTSSASRAKEARELLMHFAFIHCEAETQEITIHRLVRNMVLDELRTQGQLELVATSAMDDLANLYSAATSDETRSLESLYSYARHVEAITGLESVTPFCSPGAKLAKARLFHAMGSFLIRDSVPASAEDALRTSMRIYESLPGFESRQLPLLSALAMVCRMQGRHTEAEQLEARCRETGTQSADEADLESILSNLPSLTAGSTIASSLTLGLIEDIKSDVLTILAKDEDLHGLLAETPKRITHDKFQRNFLRLFRSFLSDIRKQSTGERELNQVIRILRYQSRNIASHICQENFDLKAQSDALSSLALQVPDKDGQLLSFLGNDSTTTPEIAGAPKGELRPDDNSSGGESDEPETVRPYPIPLSDLEVIILESTSFLTFRERYRAFLFPPSDPKPPETGILTDDNVPALDSEPLGPQIRSGLEQKGKVYLLHNLLAFVLGWLRRFLQSPVKRGHVRIEWTCDCGDNLYADFPESDGDSIRKLELFLQGQADKNGGGGTAPLHTTHPAGGLSNSTPALTPSPVSSSLQPPSSQQNNVSPTSRLRPNSQPGGQKLGGTGRATRASGSLGRVGKRFIELCVNTGEFQRQLTEIDASDVESDAQLFDRIRERYREVRSFRVKYFLLKPVDVHFVQFSVEERYRVGILDKPMAIPSQAEMAAEGYAYHPCPLKPPPIPANIFLHHLSNPGPHKRLLWGNRIPQKLHSSILQIQTPDNLVIGWGV